MSDRVRSLPRALPHRRLGFARMVIAAMSLAFVACRGGSDEPVGTIPPAEVSGTYQLETVGGVAVPLAGLGAVLDGAIVLTSDGRVIRTIRYQLSGVASEGTRTTNGTFRATSDSVAFAFIEDVAHPDLVWRPRASLANGTLTLSYANPADGPDIVEVYRGPAR